jgi:hypothetical protein
MAASTEDQTVARRRTLAKKLDAAAWGLFFIWIGVALLVNIGWGVGLLGVGLITLGAQAARKYLVIEVEGFWVAVGLLFVLGGIWELLSVRVGLVPVLLIVVGIVLLASALTGRVRGQSG